MLCFMKLFRFNVDFTAYGWSYGPGSTCFVSFNAYTCCRCVCVCVVPIHINVCNCRYPAVGNDSLSLRVIKCS